MTTFMKFEAITYLVLRVLGYIAGFAGVFGILGFVGGLEHDNITIAQFWLYEFYSFCLIGFSYIVYYIREYIREDVIRRNRIMKRRAKRLALAH
jgi:hypothetical protein